MCLFLSGSSLTSDLDLPEERVQLTYIKTRFLPSQTNGTICSVTQLCRDVSHLQQLSEKHKSFKQMRCRKQTPDFYRSLRLMNKPIIIEQTKNKSALKSHLNHFIDNISKKTKVRENCRLDEDVCEFYILNE